MMFEYSYVSCRWMVFGYGLCTLNAVVSFLHSTTEKMEWLLSILQCSQSIVVFMLPCGKVDYILSIVLVLLLLLFKHVNVYYAYY